MKILLCRTDGIGDLIQSLTGLQDLKKKYSELFIGYIVKKANAPLLKDHPFIDQIHFIEETDSSNLKKYGYDASVIMFFNRQIGQLIKKAGIPKRIGPLSKFTSFFYLNCGMRQKRSESAKNEAEYNVDLINSLMPKVKGNRPEIYNKGILSQGLPQKYVLLAPQTKGSSLNISDDLYMEIAEYLSKKIPLVIDGIENSSLTKKLERLNRNIYNLIAIITISDVVMSPRTGTLHLANALGKKVVSFYPTKPVLSITRWAPYKYEGEILISKTICRKKGKCPEKCDINCMDFNIEQVKEAVNKLLV
ncbi:MAG: hypothetical protein ABIA63_15365 [bacterium]